MFPFNYIICSNQMGNGNFGKVFKIKEINPPHTILICKIYDYSKFKEYENEKKILNLITQGKDFINNYIVKISNVEVFLENSDDFNVDSNKLVFNYLNHGQLCDYLYIVPNINQIKESHIKLLCYKILQGIKIFHEKNISHNKIDIKNIMFDNDFNPIIIHFSEASIIHNSNFKKDFFGLGIVLAKLITSGKFKSIGYNKKNNKYYIKFNDLNNQLQKNPIEETIFWKKIEIVNKIKISNEYKHFFDILIKSKDELKIDDLMKHEWLKSINNNKADIEQDLKKVFYNIYEKIIEFQNIDRYQISNYSSILNLQKKKETSLINEYIENKNKNILLDKYCEYNNYKKSNSTISYDNNIYEKERLNDSFYNEDEIKDDFYLEENDNKINIDMNNSLSDEIQEKNYQNKNIPIVHYEPKEIQFNSIEISLNENDYFCKDALVEYINKLEKNIKEFNYEKFININTEKLENNLGFKVSFEEFRDKEENTEEVLDYLYDDINDTDLMFLIINIELFQSVDSNNKYYLIFSNVQGDMADFYEYLKIIKTIATSLLNY